MWDVGALDQSHRMALVERHLISLEMAKAGGGLLLSDDETVSVMLCEEDHLRIQIMGAGLCCEGAGSWPTGSTTCWTRGCTSPLTSGGAT